MFENFSFVSDSSDPIAASTVYVSTSADISPFTSRCASPRSRERSVSPGPPIPSYRQRRDSRFDTYRPPRHPSITTLTAQLESHVLSEHVGNFRSNSPTPSDLASPSTESTFDTVDEGFFDGPETPATTVSEGVSEYSSSDFDPTLWDLSMSDLSATSSPRPSLSLEAQALSSYTMRRRQRQALVRLQCLAKRAPDLAMLIEECHPSSLPLPAEMAWGNGKSRSNSTCSLISGPGARVEKNAAVRRAPRMRKRTTT